MDHCPVVVDCWFPHQQATLPWDTYKAAKTLCDPHVAKDIIRRADDWATSEEVQSAMAMAVQEYNLEQAWHLLSDSVNALFTHFRKQLVRQDRQPSAIILHWRVRWLTCRYDMIQTPRHLIRAPTAVQLLQQCFHPWVQHVLLQTTRRNLQHARTQQKREDIRHVREQLLDALHTNDRREVWRLTRVIAGNKQGIRKRRCAIPTPLRPTATEWSSHLAQPGPAGGCRAQELWQGPPHQLQAL